ncbi:MAG: AAA family ATPase [Desulfobulbaceae bacterium]|nr:AAA family ATPase [Desulfobulbaceae bacterium]
MRLIKFEALEVSGSLNFFVEFNKDITFLTGINGSGKTTAIRLMLALITPSLQELDIIPHKRATIHIVLDDQIVSISSESDDDSVKITASGIENGD